MEGDVIILDGNLKKTDRRTLYTKMVIKDALLELLATNSFGPLYNEIEQLIKK